MGEARRSITVVRAEISIQLTDDGKVSVKAPQDKILALGLMEAAKAVIVSQAKAVSPIEVVPSGIALVKG